MAVSPQTMTGTTVSIVADVPASEDVTDYEELSFTEIGRIVAPLPELNESSGTGTLTELKDGVTRHYNTTKVVSPFDLTYVYDLEDAGQVIVRGNYNGTEEVSLSIAYPSGKTKYLQAVLGDLRTVEATDESYHGEMINVRPISLVTTDDGSSV